MSEPLAHLEDRRTGTIPREISIPCPEHCSAGAKVVLNGEYFRNLRKQADLTIVEMAQIVGCGFSVLGKMERGEVAFSLDYARLYERVADRRRRAGD